jgi:hypothetical protein
MFLMLMFLIAGGSLITTLVPPQLPDFQNHLLNGTPVLAKEVVCRDRWGTPMMPDGKGSYSIIASPDPRLIERSLIQPPLTLAPVYRPGTSAPSPSSLTAPVAESPEGSK